MRCVSQLLLQLLTTVMNSNTHLYSCLTLALLVLLSLTLLPDTKGVPSGRPRGPDLVSECDESVVRTCCLNTENGPTPRKTASGVIKTVGENVQYSLSGGSSSSSPSHSAARAVILTGSLTNISHKIGFMFMMWTPGRFPSGLDTLRKIYSAELEEQLEQQSRAAGRRLYLMSSTLYKKVIEIL